MKPQNKRGLTKVALALVIAGYCAVPAAMAEDAAWVASGTTAEFQGTIPWLYREGGDATINSTDADHIKVTSDSKGTRPAGSETDKRLYVGDTITLGWDIGDTEGDVDAGGSGPDAETKATIKWYSYSDNAGSDEKEITSAAGKTSYKIADGDRGRYIGVKIQPKTQTGYPYEGAALSLLDITTATGGGSDDDNVDPGPVVNQNLKVAIFEKGTSTNLIGGSTPIALDKTYEAKLFSDEDGDGKWSTGDIDVTANYDFAWVFTGVSKQLGTNGGIANASFDNNELVIPPTNAAAKTSLNGSARNGIDGLAIPDNGDGVQGYKLSIIYKHH
ncbi:SinI family autotransporter-associated protein [Pseudocitrobacter corydidari]